MPHTLRDHVMIAARLAEYAQSLRYGDLSPRWCMRSNDVS